jgi:hypothetical protein
VFNLNKVIRYLIYSYLDAKDIVLQIAKLSTSERQAVLKKMICNENLRIKIQVAQNTKVSR